MIGGLVLYLKHWKVKWHTHWGSEGAFDYHRTTVSKVYPAMYIENVTDLAFDDITPADPDFPSIQGRASDHQCFLLSYTFEFKYLNFGAVALWLWIFLGLAEAGLLSSKLSRRDMQSSSDDDQSPVFFCPERYNTSHKCNVGLCLGDHFSSINSSTVFYWWRLSWWVS